MEHQAKTESGNFMQCSVFNYCSAKPGCGMHCWEMARAENDFHFVFNVCLDCIVYLYEQECAGLTQRDIREILQERENCQQIWEIHH